MREIFLEMISRLEKHTGTSDLISKLEYKRSYCVEDFKKIIMHTKEMRMVLPTHYHKQQF
jgi:hypothetical protein